MKLPRGQLQRQRVVEDLATPLASALDAELTGYARLESQDAMLLAADGIGVLTFDSGVPVVAYHTGTDNGGPAALADLAISGPYRLELYELDGDVLEEIHAADDLTVPPGMPAERLAGDHGLADRTRDAAPARLVDRSAGAAGQREPGAVEAFLEDEERIEAIRERAREEAERRAEEWGFD
ncbi:hypothetical protein ACKVMT_17945 [Halobacteriales archaeon Cl-PHB]